MHRRNRRHQNVRCGADLWPQRLRQILHGQGRSVASLVECRRFGVHRSHGRRHGIPTLEKPSLALSRVAVEHRTERIVGTSAPRSDDPAWQEGAGCHRSIRAMAARPKRRSGRTVHRTDAGASAMRRKPCPVHRDGSRRLLAGCQPISTRIGYSHYRRSEQCLDRSF